MFLSSFCSNFFWFSNTANGGDNLTINPTVTSSTSATPKSIKSYGYKYRQVRQRRMVAYTTIRLHSNQRLRSITLDRFMALYKMKVFTITSLAAFLAASTSAQSSDMIYSVATSIPWSPKAPSSVDQSVVYNDTYYLSDRTNAGVSIGFLLRALRPHTLIGTCCLPYQQYGNQTHHRFLHRPC